MNLRDKLIRKLLDTGKRHRILVYPTLALVAIITAISHAVYWGRGNGKKLVASVMVMALLITQSIFLTSSADVGDGAIPNIGTPTDAENDDGIPEEEAPTNEGSTDPSSVSIEYYRVGTDGTFRVSTINPISIEDGKIKISIPTDEEKAAWSFNGDSSLSQYFNFTELYIDSSCQTPVASDGITDEEATVYQVYFMATRKAYPIVISEKDTVTGEELDPVNLTYTIPDAVTPGDIYPSINYPVGDAASYVAYKWGYNYSGLEYNGSNYTTGDIIPISPNSNSPILLGFNWMAMNFDVTYDTVGDADAGKIDVLGGSDTVEKNYTYNSDVSLMTSDDVSSIAGKEGYYLSGWNDGATTYAAGSSVNSTVLAENLSNIADSPNIKGITLTGVWTYKEIMLKATNTNCSVSIGDSGALITGTYGDNISCEINAEYKKDNSQGNKFEYLITADDINKLGAYGLNVTTSSDGSRITSYTISGELSNVTEGVTINLQITDNNKPESQRVSNHTITLVSNKREVTLNPDTVKNATSDGKPSKAYDGSEEIGVSPSAQLLNIVEGDDVKVTFDNMAKLDNANAGDNKTLTLINAALTGGKSDMYTLVGVDENTSNITIQNAAKVLRSPISVSIDLKQGNPSTFLFGQDRSEYILTINNVSDLAEKDSNIYNDLSGDAAVMSFMSTYLGFSGWDTARTIYSPAGSYTIKPIFDDTNSNYSVSTTGLSAAFTVNRDSAIQNTNYKFSTEKGANGYYPGLTITATGSYDRIRLLEAGDSDISVGMSRTEAESMFGSAIVLPDMTNGTITFQMLDSGSGAITETITLTGINIDTHPPVYAGHSVTPNISYFNDFHFGSYYHSQNIDGQVVESVTLSISYTTEGSDCDKLYYFFADEAGNAKGDNVREVNMIKNVGANNYQASITLGTGVSGQIIVYASDSTGNISVKSKIKLDDAIEFIMNDGDYYEWMIENTIDSANISVVDAEGNIASTADVWYNALYFSADAADADSGLNKLAWSITDPSGTASTREEVAGSNIASIQSVTSYGKVTGYTFSDSISGEGTTVGKYSVGGTLYDNAGNSAVLNQMGPYLLDCNAPIIKYEAPASGGYLSGVTFKFKVTDGEDESGLASVKLYMDSVDETGFLKTWGALDEYEYDIISNGKYIIVATDVAGNVSKEEVIFSGISDVIPSEPIIKIDAGAGQIGNDGWYIGAKPYITIVSEDETTDGVPVTTYYRITSGSKQLERVVSSEEYDFQLEYEGIVTIEVWSVSASNCQSDTVTATVKVDVDAPDVYISESTVDEKGVVNINFKATDDVSGINTDNVLVNGKAIEVTESDDIVTGSFKADGSNIYTIVVEDKAGNVAMPISFTPLNMYVSPVTNITSTGGYIDAEVHKGTNAISDCYISYKKASESSYTTCLSNKHNQEYGVSMDYTFRNLEPDTVYNYKVYAITKISKEVKVVEGSFRTASNNSKATLYGSVSYADDIEEGFKTYPIYVNLYDANVAIAGVQLNSESEIEYLFKNIADGAYRIVATNGMLTKESSVTVANGGISYPENYAAEGGINFVLSGLSTSVVIDDDAVNITADGLDKIYNTNLYNGNVTEEDLQVVKDGGTINISLHAGYINVTDINQTTQTIFKNKIGENAVIERYIQLNIIKEVRDANGNYVNGTPCNITRLAEPITVSFPLGELSGQKVYVASLHGEGSNYDFLNWSSASDISISKSFVTIETDRFSVYALYRVIDAPKEYTVKWIDGNGNIMKTETVTSGNSATPPKETPKKTATDKYTYIFSGWDTDYSSVTKDAVISARFTANKKDDNNNNDNTNQNNGNNTDNKDNNGDNNGAKPADVSKSTVTYTYMGSAESPVTGDSAPIVIILAVMLFVASGMVFIRKKFNKH